MVNMLCANVRKCAGSVSLKKLTPSTENMATTRSTMMIAFATGRKEAVSAEMSMRRDARRAKMRSTRKALISRRNLIPGSEAGLREIRVTETVTKSKTFQLLA